MEQDCGTGQRWPDRPLHVGVQNMGIHLMVRWGSPLSTAALALRGYDAPLGPVLSDAPWDAVLVTSARSRDGHTLDVTMRPRRDSPVMATLTFDALRPGTHYRLVLGAAEVDVPADGDGRGRAEVRLVGPVHAELRPIDGGT